ncbi:DUF5753 domain-containing protein [Yinghuangia seranimata]|uniref:DUF5753 domain-containing protein n=1 Tax=Yinghuangia seranimata TaxID=408067 RepID=UPI00248B9F65|nr:DUF5753 domain-containing protein [Yinghuangia seranimata]MDI2132297.1 DUF5753 domain-containing protein [Yinghuangia seranimata]
MYSSAQPPLSPDEIEAKVEARMARKEILTRADPTQVWIVLDEVVLMRWPSGASIVKPQLQTLLDLGDLPNVTVLVVPINHGVHAGRDGSQTLLSFTGSDDLGYVEPPGGGLVISDFMRVASLRRRYDLLLTEALSSDKSAQLIHSRMEGS